MSRDVIELALRRHFRREDDPAASARQALAQYDAEHPSTEAYVGELVMLRGVVATLRVVAEHGDLPKVRQVLAEHQRDEQDAYAEQREKSSPTGADATPGPTGRVAQLLNAIRTHPGTWTTNKAFDVYRQLPAHAGMPLGLIRSFARCDLRDLAAWGHLTASEESGRREYHLNTRKDHDQ